MPAGPDEEYDEAYANAGKLHAAGVKIAFATFNSADSRTLPYEAAMTVPYGLPEEAALEGVMKNGAEMLGLGDKMGTIETGRLANIIVTVLSRATSSDGRPPPQVKLRPQPRGGQEGQEWMRSLLRTASKWTPLMRLIPSTVVL
jgi:hypothetical protein